VDVRAPLSEKIGAIVREGVMGKEMLGLTILSAGVMGAAVTLFANLLAPLDMADWAWWIVQNWQEITPAFWDRIAAWFGLEVPSSLVPPLNLATLLVLTAIGVRIRDRGRDRATVRSGVFHLVAGGAALLAIGYIVVVAPAYATPAADVPPEASLTIFLAAAAASFSPILAGRGNLILRLWYILAGVGGVLALNELTKLAVAA